MLNRDGWKRLPSGGSVGGEERGRGASAAGVGGTNHRATAGGKRRENPSPSSADISSGSSWEASKRERQAPANVPVTASPVAPTRGESSMPAEDGWFPESTAAAVIMETRLFFEGSGSLQSRRRQSSSNNSSSGR